MTKPLTTRQAEALNFAWHFFKAEDQIPTRQVIATHFGWNSPNAAEDVLQALHRKGLLAVNALGKFKFTELSRQTLEHGDWVGTPTVIKKQMVDKALEQLNARKPANSIFAVGAA